MADGIHRRLKMARKLAGLSQSDVADLFDISQSAFSAWETGSTSIHVDQAETLAALYDVPLFWLIGGIEASFIDDLRAAAAQLDETADRMRSIADYLEDGRVKQEVERE